MEFLEKLGETVSGIGNHIINILPKSPITYLESIPEVEKYLGMVNWFIPIYTMIGLTEAWLTAVAIYYVVQAVLRWAKIIE